MKQKPTVLACSVVESFMHGVAYFRFKGKQCTAVYTDNTEETAEIPEALRVAQWNYFLYQNENGSVCDPPNPFALVSAIQSKRETTTV